MIFRGSGYLTMLLSQCFQLAWLAAAVAIAVPAAVLRPVCLSAVYDVADSASDHRRLDALRPTDRPPGPKSGLAEIEPSMCLIVAVARESERVGRTYRE